MRKRYFPFESFVTLALSYYENFLSFPHGCFGHCDYGLSFSFSCFLLIKKFLMYFSPPSGYTSVSPFPICLLPAFPVSSPNTDSHPPHYSGQSCSLTLPLHSTTPLPAVLPKPPHPLPRLARGRQCPSVRPQTP